MSECPPLNKELEKFIGDLTQLKNNRRVDFSSSSPSDLLKEIQIPLENIIKRGEYVAELKGKEVPEKDAAKKAAAEEAVQEAVQEAAKEAREAFTELERIIAFLEKPSEATEPAIASVIKKLTPKLQKIIDETKELNKLTGCGEVGRGGGKVKKSRTSVRKQRRTRSHSGRGRGKTRRYRKSVKRTRQRGG